MPVGELLVGDAERQQRGFVVGRADELDHKRVGNPVAAMKDGKIVIIQPEDIRSAERIGVEVVVCVVFAYCTAFWLFVALRPFLRDLYAFQSAIIASLINTAPVTKSILEADIAR